MKILDLKPTHKAITAYYAELRQLAQVEAEREGAVSPPFATLLKHCAKQFNWTLYEQYPLKAGNKHIYPDGALVNAAFPIVYGYWEAKKTQVALEEEIRQKFERGYPHDNILFQTPERAILYQDGRPRLDCDISRPEALVEILKAFFAYQPPEYEEWQQAVEAFKAEVPKIGHGVLKLIENERQTNKGFQQAFEQFTRVCGKPSTPIFPCKRWRRC